MTMLILAAAAAFSFGEVKVECKDPADGWRVSLVREVAPDGAEIAKLSLDSDVERVPPKTWLSLDVPQVGMHNAWSVNDLECGVRANWEAGATTEVSRGLPVFVYFDGNDTSHFAVAAEECVRHLRYSGGVREEGSMLSVRICWFDAGEKMQIGPYGMAVRGAKGAKGEFRMAAGCPHPDFAAAVKAMTFESLKK